MTMNLNPDEALQPVTLIDTVDGVAGVDGHHGRIGWAVVLAPGRRTVLAVFESVSLAVAALNTSPAGSTVGRVRCFKETFAW